MACAAHDLQGDTGRLHVVDGEGRLLGLAHRLGELEHVRLHEEPAARRDARGEGSRLASGER